MILDHLTPLEIFCALLAAVTHDLDHPGVNQPFLIATSNHLAALYKVNHVFLNHLCITRLYLFVQQVV